MEDTNIIVSDQSIPKKNIRKRTIPSKKKVTVNLDLFEDRFIFPATGVSQAQTEIDAYNASFNRGRSLREQILLAKLDVPTKASILNRLDESAPGNDHKKYINWVKDILQLPFDKKVTSSCNLSKGPDAVRSFLENTRSLLDNAVTGQENAKDEIIDFVARTVSNPNSRGNVIALVGPKGCGKTRLVRRGVAEALNRPFHVINLGGMNDVHVLTGHDFTYTSAKYGRIAHILIQSQCNNPVIYLDEIDKIQSLTDKGMEIFRVLTHVLDEEQNHEFVDEYFSGMKLDLSNILFVASLNDISSIESVLRDRLKFIHINSLDLKTKLQILRAHIMPELLQDISFPADSVTLNDDVLQYIIKSKTPEEDGCRGLRRSVETIFQKLNTMKITKTGLFESGDHVTVSRKTVDDLLKNMYVENDSYLAMYR
jgi:ATP-dependent Lon protease